MRIALAIVVLSGLAVVALVLQSTLGESRCVVGQPDNPPSITTASVYLTAWPQFQQTLEYVAAHQTPEVLPVRGPDEPDVSGPTKQDEWTKFTYDDGQTQSLGQCY